MDKVGGFANKNKCSCCNNPWNVNDYSNDSSSIICTPCLNDDKGFSGINIENIDNTINLKDNFYLWTNGGWIKNNPIPLEYPSWNTFTQLFDLNLSRLQTILEELQESSRSKTFEEIQLADFYNSFMNEIEIEKRSIEPILPYIQLALNTNYTNLINTVAELHAKCICNPFFTYYASPDKKNSDHTICSIQQGGIGLPDKDYYFDSDKADKCNEYIQFIANILNLIGDDNIEIYQNKANNIKIAQSIFEFEKNIASAHLTKTQARDPELTYNMMSLDELNNFTKPTMISYSQYLVKGKTSNGFNFLQFFDLFGKHFNKKSNEFGNVNVSSTRAMKKISEICESPVLPHYLVFHIIKNNCDHLPKKYVDEKWLFYEKKLSGTVEQKPRWKRGLLFIESSLGEALSKIYVTKYFDEDSKVKALRIVELVLNELKERINELEWMKQITKQEAILKMDKFRVKIGYPDKFIDYSKCVIVNGYHLENIFSSRNFNLSLEINRMNNPTDRDQWHMTAQTVNAYYHPNLNEIVFPAAILQPPFFNPTADDAINFGSFGAVVSHEMTHGFDDKGRKFDWAGNLRDWWDDEDSKEYEKRAKQMIDQASSVEVFGLKLNGKLTQGENIADLGGLKLSYRALQRTLKTSDNKTLINGFTPNQRFFIGWAQLWRQNIKEERAKQLVTLDPHGPNEWRGNGMYLLLII